MPSPTLAIARHELRTLSRSRGALAAAGTTLLLLLASALASLDLAAQAAESRARQQAEAERQWQAQPDRHPHRVIHFGTFVFQPLGPLAAIDPGITAHTGHSLFLEGHRQNSANFAEARQSSVLLRFGLPTPAFVLQALAPLLLVFLAFGSVAAERERGTLALLRAQGVPGRTLLAGKALAHGGVALALLLPLALAILLAAGGEAGALARGALMLPAYGAWLLAWSLGAILASALLPRARDALLTLLGAWILLVVVAPRLAPLAAEALHPAPSRLAAELAVAADLAKVGDPHDPNDPNFGPFRARVLAQHGVTDVEALPVNWGGLVSMEGERLQGEVFRRHMDAAQARERAQAATLDGAAWLAPALALRRLSMALAGTDLPGHQAFVRAAEEHRYAMVQALNALHVHKIRRQDDRAQRVGREHWLAMPAFHHAPPGPDWPALLPAAGALLLWLLLPLALLPLAGRRLDREARA